MHAAGFVSQQYLSGRTDRVDQLAHVALNDSNAVLGLNAAAAGLTSADADNVLLGTDVAAAGARLGKNVFVGSGAARDARDVVSCVVLGAGAGSRLDGSANNVFIGCGAGRLASRVQMTTALGCEAGAEMYLGARNVLVGAQAGRRAEAAERNTLVGDSSGVSLRDGADDVFVGAGAGANVSSSYASTMVGAGAGDAASGNANIFVGVAAGAGVRGSRNIVVGTDNALAGNVRGCIVFGSRFSANGGGVLQNVVVFGSGLDLAPGDSDSALFAVGGRRVLQARPGGELVLTRPDGSTTWVANATDLSIGNVFAASAGDLALYTSTGNLVFRVGDSAGVYAADGLRRPVLTATRSLAAFAGNLAARVLLGDVSAGNVRVAGTLALGAVTADAVTAGTLTGNIHAATYGSQAAGGAGTVPALEALVLALQARLAALEATVAANVAALWANAAELAARV